MENKAKAIIVDLDGTLCLFKGNGPNGEDLRKPFYVEDDECHHYSVDKLNEVVNSIIHSFFLNGYNIIFCSGRTNNNREVTEKWLSENISPSIFDWELFMRLKGDFRKDSEIKLEIYKEYIEPNYDVFFCLDDRNQVVEMWRSLGLTCLQVAPGDF